MILNILDGGLTYWAITSGQAVEGNPVLNRAWQYGWLPFFALKFTSAAIVLGVYRSYRAHRKIRYAMVFGNILIGAVVVYEILNLI